MTPKEKADELIDKYYDSVTVILMTEAIDCALIAVNEIINLDNMNTKMGNAK
jgi:hypothetical protein